MSFVTKALNIALKNSTLSNCITGFPNVSWTKNILNETSARKYSKAKSFRIKHDYILHNLKKGPETEYNLSAEDAIKFYKLMVQIRQMEGAAAKLYLKKVIRGFLHLYSGQEACLIGMRFSMREQDAIIGHYRIHGTCLSMGGTIKSILAELAGRASGNQLGKGGSMHLYNKNFYGGHGIVGAQVPVGTGVAYANKLKKNGGVCFTLMGDGTINQGQVYEAFNMAALWKVPVIYVVENNGYAMGTSVERASGLPKLYQRGHYIPGIWVDGMDVIATINASRFAIDYAINKGPILMEFATYRYYGHSMSDPGVSYRSRDEVQNVRTKKDPIKLFEERMKQLDIPEKVMKDIQSETKTTVKKAIDEISKEKELPLPDVASDILVDPIGHVNVRGTLPWKTFKHKRIGKEINKR